MTDQLMKDISYLLSEGVSLIATGIDKKPANDWKKRPKLDAIQLSDDMFKHRTECVAIRLGEQSGGMMCIDIDEKHYLGFSKRFFDDFKIFFPEIWCGCRVEKTPSGGFHIFFRKEGITPNTKFVAYRAKTDEEKAEWTKKWRSENAGKLDRDGKEKKEPKPPEKECFLELRGEESLCQTYPSIGYKIAKENEGIGICTVVSEEEFAAIESFCCSFNEVIAHDREVTVKGKKSEEDWYEVNPFEDFDNRDEGKILEQQGWTYRKSSGGKDWYSKPGRKDKDIDAWYNSEKGFYNIFSTNCGIDAKGYSPANLLAQLKFDGDKKKMWAYLVETGYGKLNKAIELREIRKRVVDGKPLMKNVSEEGKKLYEEERGKREENYPYGIFWEDNGEGIIKINVEALLKVSHGLGFRNYQKMPARINFGRIERIEPRYYFDFIKEYIKLEGELNVYDAYERFLHTFGKTVISRLKEIPETDLLKSTKHVSYKYFDNCFVKVTKDYAEVKDYSEIPEGKLILDENVRKRNFTLLEEAGLKKYKDSLYYDFLTRAIISEKEGVVDVYLMKTIGFMIHDFKDQESYMPAALEADEEVGGGSGKNIFYTCLGQSITYLSVAASQVKNDSSFLQSWRGQRLLHLSDLPKKYDIEWLKDLIDQGAKVKRLFKDEYDIPVEDAPKICVSSNYSIDTTDVGIKRRTRQIEFSDFFIKVGGVREFYGKMFCSDWTEEDFMYFDNFMIECLQVYLLDGGKIEKKEFTESGWIKQFEQKFNHLRDFILGNIERWKSEGFVSLDSFNKTYDEYCKENKILKPYSSYVVNLALKSYCENHKLMFDKNATKRENSVLIKGRIFGSWSDNVSEPEKDDVPF